MEVRLLASGEPVASLAADDFEGKTPRVVKQQLAAQVGVNRFRQRLFWEDGSEIPNDHVFAADFVKLQLVKLEYWPSDNEEDRQMMRASNDGDSAALEELLQRPRDPNELLQRPRDPNVTDDRGNMPLHHAAHGGHLEPIRLLLEAGADINSKGELGKMPIHVAASHGHADVVRLLVNLGAQKDQPDNNGKTPAIYAASWGHLETLRFLAEVGADIDHAQEQGATPLWVAAGRGHLETVRWLVEAGANKDHPSKDTGATPLHIATERGNLDIVCLLVEAGANKDPPLTGTGLTPLIITALQGNIDIARLLVEAGANKDQQASDGLTPLHIAAQVGHLEVVRLLVESGADCDATTSVGATAGDVALWFGHEDIYRFLTQFSAAPPPRKVRRVGERLASGDFLWPRLPCAVAGREMYWRIPGLPGIASNRQFEDFCKWPIVADSPHSFLNFVMYGNHSQAQMCVLRNGLQQLGLAESLPKALVEACQTHHDAIEAVLATESAFHGDLDGDVFVWGDQPGEAGCRRREIKEGSLRQRLEEAKREATEGSLMYMAELSRGSKTPHHLTGERSRTLTSRDVRDLDFAVFGCEGVELPMWDRGHAFVGANGAGSCLHVDQVRSWRDAGCG
eukprot:s401_g37.t1